MDRVVARAEVLAVIPARGGSQGIPGKNLRQLRNHPLVAWSIAAGQQARLVNRVIVSTDDEDIARVALACGAEVPFFRPSELAQNDTRDYPVFQHAIEWLEQNDGYHPDIVVQLRPTSPLRPKGLIDAAIELLLSDERADSVRSVTPPSQNPYKMWTISGGLMKPLLRSDLPESYNAPRQLLPETYWQTGHVDVFRTGVIREKFSLTGERILPVKVDSRYALDIDTLTHLRMAEEVLAEAAQELVQPSFSNPSLFAEIDMLVFDFDGVFTDNRVYVDQCGVESVSCSRADGLGIERLLKHGLKAAVLSSEVNPIVAARCQKLKLPVKQNLADKGQALRDLAAANGITLDRIAYIGNDVNDLECFELAGVAVVPSDAHPLVLKAADLVLLHPGGHGAVREICELTIAAHDSGKGAYACSESWQPSGR